MDAGEETGLELENPSTDAFSSIDEQREEDIREKLYAANDVRYRKDFTMHHPETRFWEEEERCQFIEGSAEGMIEPEEALKWWSRFSQSHIIHSADIYQTKAGNVGNRYNIELKYEKRTGMEQGELVLDCFYAEDDFEKLVLNKDSWKTLI